MKWIKPKHCPLASWSIERFEAVGDLYDLKEGECYFPASCDKHNIMIRKDITIIHTPFCQSCPVVEKERGMGFNGVDYTECAIFSKWWWYHNGVKFNQDKESVVYFLKDSASGLIKIGYSTNINNRLKGMKTANPNIKLIKKLKGNQSLEKELHERFREFRVKGEWFKPELELIKFIEGIK